MKKMTRILILIIIVGMLGFGLWQVRQTSPVKSTSIVTAIINSISYSDVQATTPYDALVVIAKKNNLVLQTKQYDFGVFVEGIGDKKNTQAKAWIYYVNGKSGEVSADKYELKQGDSVEWKYTTPIY